MPWIKSLNNLVLQGEGFYISYLDNTHDDSFLDVFEELGDLVGIKTGQTETALVVPNSTPKFRILNGDFRKEYESLVPKGLGACVEFYEQNKAAHRSDWGTDEE